MSVVILVADGARPDTLAAAMDAGSLPALARLREEGGLHTVTSTFPSVTGPAYTPFLVGRYPGPIGLPGIRWYDRGRTAARWPGNSRSYVGSEMRKVDQDLEPSVQTAFELADSSLGALNVIGRGLRQRDRLGRGARFVLRAALTHFTGNVRGWLAIDRDIGRSIARRLAHDNPRFVFAALTGIDKTSHAEGHAAPAVREAMQIVDETAARIRADAERLGRWQDMHLWIVSDHGHSPVTAHDDLVALFRSWKYRPTSHPWVFAGGSDIAVMVSGNAMAHLYLELGRRDRPWWPELAARWGEIADALANRESVDLLLLPHSPTRCEVRGRGRGRAFIEHHTTTSGAAGYAYLPDTGDPLGIGEHARLTATEAHEITAASDHPDAIVQIAHLAGAPRSGEIILSASRGWDYRGRYEPIPHVSSHGALHREHMLVPLLVNRPVRVTPRRTVDVLPSALEALGLAVPAGVDGESFL